VADRDSAEGPTDLPDRVRRRLDDVFGDVLPDVTRDETPEPPDRQPGQGGDEWLRANRPPHHEE
jgi:hypothetical protein